MSPAIRVLPAAALGAAIIALAGAPAEAAARQYAPGAPSLGDRLFPGLGNGGYDVRHYDLDLRYGTSDPTAGYEGGVTIEAQATQGLSRFNLDFAGQGVESVTVDRRRAAWVRQGEELVITPQRPLRDGRRFVVRVAGFSASPTVPDPEKPFTSAFIGSPDGSATAPQPDLAHDLYPSNDHPRDKASFTFRLDVPEGRTAVANGLLTSRRTRDGRTRWRYVQRQPMATELTQLAVGNFAVTSPGVHPGVLVRDVTPRRLTAELEPKLARVREHLRWMEAWVERYPFDAYGSLVLDADFGFALETQTLSLYPVSVFRAPQGVWEPIMVHELAHEWFGNSVSPWEWSDLWLNEGHASWYEFLYAEEHGLLKEDTTGWPNEEGYAELEELMRAVYALGDRWRAQYGPVAQPVSGEIDDLFSFNVYHGGALVLYALRNEIGAEAFDRVEREWVDAYRYRSASTADFIALASRVAGRDLDGFLRAWLYGTETPPMPGHPDWTVLPVEEPAPRARSARR